MFRFRKSFFICILFVTGLLGCDQVGGIDYNTCMDEGECVASVDVVRYSGALPLSPDSKFWNSPKGPQKVLIDLGPQLITNPQWPNPSTKQVRISAARTPTEIAVRLEWADDSVDDGLKNSRLYTDQAAIMFPLDRTKELPPITMGAPEDVVNIWQWKAVRQRDVESGTSPPHSPVEDLNAEGFSTLTQQDQQDVQGKGIRNEKGWQVVFKRSITNKDEHDAQFAGSIPMSVAIWNGGNRETNGQKGLMGWILLKFVG